MSKTITYCKITDCNNGGARYPNGHYYLSLGMCRIHYVRFKKTGDPNKVIVGGGNRIDGRSREDLYQLYLGMIRRCSMPHLAEYKYYGGRGIKVCDRWSNKERGIWNFIEDMGQRPSREYSLDRIDVDGHYEPGNCRWATSVEQANNKRNSKKRLTKPHPVV